MSAAKTKKKLDLAPFPPGSITEYTTLVCLACTFDIFTTQIGLAPRTAYSEIKKYSPTIAELSETGAVRPFFDSDERNPHCPYCNAAKRWHARFDTTRIEDDKTTAVARRNLIKKLPQKDEQFLVMEAKSDKRTTFFDWLHTLGQNLDIEEDDWLLATSRAQLARRFPKDDWEKEFSGVRNVRRSRRLTDSWEREGSRLFLAPELYSEVLLVQYLVSRSHVRGGLTNDGRLTLHELVRRLHYNGYLDQNEIRGDQFEILDQLIEKISGGTAKAKLYYIVDRRDFLEKVKTVYARYS